MVGGISQWNYIYHPFAMDDGSLAIETIYVILLQRLVALANETIYVTLLQRLVALANETIYVTLLQWMMNH